MFHPQFGINLSELWACKQDKGFWQRYDWHNQSFCHRIVSCLYTQRLHRVQDRTGVHAQLTSHHDSHLFHCLCSEDVPSLSSTCPPDTAHTTSLKLYCLFPPIALAIRHSRSRDLSRSLFNMAPNVMSSAHFTKTILFSPMSLIMLNGIQPRTNPCRTPLTTESVVIVDYNYILRHIY